MSEQEEYQRQAEEQKKQQMEEFRVAVLGRFVSAKARDRLNKVKLVKPEKALAVENFIIQAVQSGSVKTEVTEEEVVALLERNSQSKAETKLNYKRHTIDDEW